MEDRYKHIQDRADHFNKIMATFEQGDLEPREAIIKGLNQIKILLDSAHAMYGEPYFNMTTLFKAIDQTSMGSQKNTLKEGFLTGCLIQGLVLFGSSKNQAYDFLNRWMGISNSSMKAAYNLFLKEYEPSASKEEFIKDCYMWIIEIIDQNDKPAPMNFPKTSPAYKALIEACYLQKDTDESEEWLIYRGHSYE